MKALFFFFILIISILPQNSPNFEEYFLDETLRIDYFHIGDAKTEMITIDKLFRYGIWTGSLNHLVDNLNNGKYYVKIYDAASNKLIYSKGFDTFFGEYATGDDGINGILKSFHETVIIPLPKNKIIFALEKRNDTNILVEFFRTEVDPQSIYIIKDKIADASVEILKPVYNGDPHKKVDTSGFLLKKTYRITLAMSGLRNKLERPVPTEDALQWRLNGPIGVQALANAISKEAKTDEEKAFLMTELALELSRVEASSGPGFLPKSKIKNEIRFLIEQLKNETDLCRKNVSKGLNHYINVAFKEALS